MELSKADLKAAIAAGIIHEGEASQIIDLARHAIVENQQNRSESITVFRSFNEVYSVVSLAMISISLYHLFSLWIDNFWVGPMLILLLAWGGLEYFFQKRRQVFAGIYLSIQFCFFAFIFLEEIIDPELENIFYLTLITAGMVFLIYARFKLPFSLFLLGFFIILSLLLSPMIGINKNIFDLNTTLNISVNPIGALSLFVTGLILFIVAMRFDRQDPLRQSRLSDCGFWLHLVAGTAMIQPVSFTLLQAGETFYGLLFLVILLLTFVAMVIDRRSIIFSAAAYLLALMIYLINFEEGRYILEQIALIMILVGGGLAWVGTAWVKIRAKIMGKLPDFPGKDQLPPWIIEN